MSDYTVSDLIAEFLERIGAETAFGVISVHNIPIMDAIRKRNRVRLHSARGEAGGGHMADGAARASGRIGVLVSSTGPGAANACGALYEAWTAATPLLHVTGQSKSEHIERGRGTTHETKDQLGMLASVGKAAFRIRSANEALGVLTRAATEALTAPCGPVSVEAPADLQRAPVERPAALDDLTLPIPPLPRPTPEAIARLVDMVRLARRPILWLGNGAAGARASVLRLIEANVPCVSSWNGRAVAPEDNPMTLGAMNGGGIPLIEEFYATCDLMIVAGSRLRGHETIDFSVKLPSRRVQIDIDPAADGRTYPNDLFVLGDAGHALAALADGLEGWTPDPALARDLATAKARGRKAFRATLGPYGSFAEQLRAAMPRDAIFARDVTIAHSTWGHRLVDLFEPWQNIYPVAAGIGQGLSMAIGAALTGRARTVCLTGDGGLMMNLGELWTAAQERADLTIIVMNDSGYGVIRHIQDATGAGRGHTHLQLPDLGVIARETGMSHATVTAPGDFGPTLREAMTRPGPALIEVDMTRIGEASPYFPYGPKVEAVD